MRRRILSLELLGGASQRAKCLHQDAALGQSGAHFVFAPDVFNRAQRDLTCLSRSFLPPRVLQSCACTYMRLKRGGLILLLLLLLFLKDFIPPPQGETLQSAQVFAQKRDRRWFAWSNGALALCR